MATPKKTYPYALYYNDGSYMIYDLTQEDFDHVSKVMRQTVNFQGGIQPPTSVELSIGLINLKDIRSVIKQKPLKPIKKTEGAIPDLTPEEIEWMVANKTAWKEEGGYEQ